MSDWGSLAPWLAAGKERLGKIPRNLRHMHLCPVSGWQLGHLMLCTSPLVWEDNIKHKIQSTIMGGEKYKKGGIFVFLCLQ